ncbi:MAG: hypothetical protein OEW91_16195, partial [Acidimicrobiia bacterium]|nr:hypothetical protein [Acidimicrobiia bacterium]
AHRITLLHRSRTIGSLDPDRRDGSSTGSPTPTGSGCGQEAGDPGRAGEVASFLGSSTSRPSSWL